MELQLTTVCTHLGLCERRAGLCTAGSQGLCVPRKSRRHLCACRQWAEKLIRFFCFAYFGVVSGGVGEAVEGACPQCLSFPHLTDGGHWVGKGKLYLGKPSVDS